MHLAMIGTTAPSHIYPSLAVIAEMVQRGHRVTYAVGRSAATIVEPSGAEIVSWESILPQGQDAWPDDPAAAMHVFLDETLAAFGTLTHFYDHDRPDLLLYDIGGLAAPVLGVRYGVPAVQLSPAYVAWDGYADDLADIVGPLRSSAAGERYHAVYSEWLRGNGIDTDPWDWITYPEHCLSLIPRVMQPHADRVGDHVQFVGPCLDPNRLADRSWTPPAGTIVYVSFGTGFNEQPDFYRLCVQTFTDTDWHVVISVGHRVDPTDLGELPPNVEIHRHVPQLAVLDAASVFVTHAGMGGCTESLWFGVPTVAIPQAVDQFGNADMLVELGVGAQLTMEEATMQTLLETVEGALTLTHRAAEISAEVRAHGGVTAAADAVERFLA
ncbi:macrolide family glycosyltransferase [Williamsia sp. MIQD14]|uniref:macrolide family glycosyltransferase n=1 Tax=Williamsia sp. MIQD14 TaxID=3425703 RepID=UPI003D9FEC48